MVRRADVNFPAGTAPGVIRIRPIFSPLPACVPARSAPAGSEPNRATATADREQECDDAEGAGEQHAGLVEQARLQAELFLRPVRAGGQRGRAVFPRSDGRAGRTCRRRCRTRPSTWRPGSPARRSRERRRDHRHGDADPRCSMVKPTHEAGRGAGSASSTPPPSGRRAAALPAINPALRRATTRLAEMVAERLTLARAIEPPQHDGQHRHDAECQREARTQALRQRIADRQQRQPPRRRPRHHDPSGRPRPATTHPTKTAMTSERLAAHERTLGVVEGHRASRAR